MGLYTHTHTHRGIFNKEKLRSEKGSITVFVLATMLFMLVITTVFYTSVKTKTVAQAKDINKIQEEYSNEENLEGEMEEKYEDIKDTVDTEITIMLYKLTGEEYQVSEWTNQDIKMRLNYYGGEEPEDKYFYIDGEKIDYVEDYLITKNCTITAEYMGEQAKVVVSRIDKENPTIKLEYDGGTFVMPTQEETAKITTTIEAEDAKSGVKTIEYAWGESNVQEPNSYTKLEKGNKVQKVDCKEGTYYLWTKVTDIAGNETKYTSKAFTVLSRDDAGSKITLSADKTEWTNTNVIVTATYGANLIKGKKLTSTGKSGTDYTINGTSSVTVKTNNQTITAEAEDLAGNKVIETYKVTNIDKVAPTKPEVTNSSNGNWTSESVKITLKSTDKESGIDHYEWFENNAWTTRALTTSNGIGTITYGGERKNVTIRYRAVDKVGNISEEATTVINLDKTAPVISPITNSSNQNWTNKDIQLSWSITEDGSGIAKVEHSSDGKTWAGELQSYEWYGLTRNNQRNDTIYIRATDKAGNVSNVQSTNMKIDKTKPTITLSPDGQTTSNKTLSSKITAKDTGGSNLKTLQYAWSTSNTQEPSSYQTFTNEQPVSKSNASVGKHYLWVKVSDNAGNQTSKVSKAFNVTGLTGGTTKYVKKGGTITLTPTKQGDAGEITWTTSDSNGASLSTTKGNSVTVTGKTAGTYTVTAKESAGGATTSYKIEVTQLTSGGNLTVLEGNTAQLKAPTKSSNAGTITYSVTSGSNYASVNSSTGQVTGKEALAEKTTATITAEESNGGATCTYTVTIKVWNGNGLLSDPYKISNPRDFKKLAEKVNKATSTSSTTTGTAYRYTSKYFKQTANIALGGSSSNLYTQIGKSSTAYFNGTYDGNSKTISGIYLSTSSSIAGTFNRLGSNGTIKNLGIISSTVRSTSTTEAGSLGAICGVNLGTIQNCYNKGVAVTGPSGVGGICGKNQGIIKNSHNTGTITGSKHNVGGITGWNQKQITDSYNTGAIKFSGSGTWYAYGGIVGWNDGSVNATATQVYRCYNTGTINGCQYVGGVAGTNEHSARVFYSYNRNSVSGTKFVGGLVGVNNQEGYIRNCYNRSVVKGDTHIGGLVGANQYGAMTYNSYNTGKVTGTTNIGGVVGYNRDSGSVTSRCYYLNGTAPAGGANDGTATLSVTVKTSAQMQEAAFVTLLDTGNSQKFWKADTTSTVKYPILSWQ